MYKFITNRVTLSPNTDHIIVQETLKNDNLGVFKIINVSLDIGIVTDLFKFKSLRIIEHLRYKARPSRNFERVIYGIAVNSNNQIVIDYALEKNYSCY